MIEHPHRRVLSVAAARFVVAAILLGWHAAPVTAQKPVWQTIPDDALFVVRVPAPREFYDALKTRTKLGAVAFDERRLNALKDVIVEDSKDDFEILATQFAKIGLETEDVLALAAGEIGYAGLARESDDGKSSYFGLGWCECGEEAARRWLAALDKSLADQSDAKFPIRREDVELGGVAVRHLVAPHLNTDDRQFGINLEARNGQIDIFKKDGEAEKPESARNDKPVVVTGCVHLLIGRFQNKLLALHTMPQIASGDEPDAETLAELERSTGDAARAAMAGWLEAQTGGGEGVVQRWLQTPGLVDALPEGVPALEIIGDLKRAIAQLGAPSAPEQRQLLEALGLDGVGPAGYRIALDGTTLRSGTFFSVPEPRRGVLAVLNEAMPLPPQPADWVADDVLGYQHLSLDFGKTYRQVTDVLRRNSPEAEKSIANIEAQVQDFLQTDVVSLLSSLGDKHMLVSFLPNDAAAAKEDQPQQNNIAFVWRITDEALWKRLLQMAALVAGQQVKQEQGFSGLRHETPQFSGGWFIGDGTMVLAFGKEVTEKTLAMLRRPPALGDSLAGSPQARRATELISARNAVTYEITNGSSALHFMNQAAAQMLAETSDPALKRLKEAWPTEEEMKDLVGVSAAATYVDQHGLTHRSVSELPAP